MPFTMNSAMDNVTCVERNHQALILADGGCDGYRHQWTPTHLQPSSSKRHFNSHSSSSSSSGKENGVKDAPTYPTKLFPIMSEAKPVSPANGHFPKVVPLPLSNFSPGISPGMEQEKVSVRLVENQGLVVEEAEELIESQVVDTGYHPQFMDSQECYGLFEPSGEKNSQVISHVNCLENSKRTTCPGHSSKISASLSKGAIRLSRSPPPPKYVENEGRTECGCEQTQILSPNGYPHHHQHHHTSFSRTRHGSTSIAGGSSGVSSLTPLMTGVEQLKDSHKIPVIVKPSSMKHQQGGSNIHLYCALVLGFSASLFFSLTLLLAKVLKNRDHHPISIAFWRYLGILVPSVPLGMYYFFRGKKSKVVGSVWPIHDMDKAANALALLMRGVLGSTAVILRFCSLKYLTIADSSVISYCAPVFAAIFTPFCIKKDKGGVIPVLVGMLTAFGVFLVCRPPFLGGVGGGYNGDTLKGVFLAVLSMLCGSGVLIIVRNLLQKVHFSLMIFVLGIWGVFEAGVLALSLDVLKVPELLPDIVMVFGVGILTFFGQLFVLLAMRMGQVGSAVSVMRSCDIFLSFLWQYLFLKTEPELLGILSATLIILAVWFICFRKWLISLRENHSVRQQLSLMLY